MATVMTEWDSTKPNPDEEHLRKLWEAEFNLKASLAEEDAFAERRRAKIWRLIEASGLSGEIDGWVKEDTALSKNSLEAAEPQLAEPSIDIEALHEQDVELAQAHEELMGPSKANPTGEGIIWPASYCGRKINYYGEAEEVPGVVLYNWKANRVEPRAQAYGEGLGRSRDWSSVHAYLAFTLTPPSWGHLHIHTGLWLHGWYHLYSNDHWYNSAYALADLRTWVQVHQDFWRGPQYRRQFYMGGDELHPTRYGRIDRRCWHSYYTNVGAGNRVTILVGAYLHCYARAGGNHSRLDFMTGAANYISVPYVYWQLYH